MTALLLILQQLQQDIGRQIQQMSTSSPFYRRPPLNNHLLPSHRGHIHHHRAHPPHHTRPQNLCQTCQ